jgi:hypothetical protein
MDSQQFARPSKPSFMPIINEHALRMAAQRIEAPEKRTVPVEDVRYPGYASQMSDARIVTDYKSHCANNVAPSRYGNSIRTWLQHNGDAMIQTSRHRQAERAGAYFYNADTTVPPKQLQSCDEFECLFSVPGHKDALGLEREEGVPSLFGTFARPNQRAPSKRVFLTDIYEGGRNSLRGRQYVPLGNQSFDPRKTGMGSSG